MNNKIPLRDQPKNDQLKVLLVDDEKDAYLTLLELFNEPELSGYCLDWTSSTDEALISVNARLHDAYIVDYRLGIKNGLELIRESRTAGYDGPMILLTGYGSKQLDIEAMQAGASDFLAKGRFSIDILERTLRYAIERTRAQKERDTLEYQLQHSQKLEAIGQLTGGVAHDFNNLLTAILSYAQLGLDGANNDPAHDAQFREIRRAAERAAELTQHLLAFSRRQPAKPAVLNLNDLITGMQSMLQRLMGEQIQLVTQLHNDLGMVKADQGQIEQTIINMAVNAKDAMPHGGKLIIKTANVHLGLTALAQHPELKPGNYITFSITDTGTGMTEEVKRRAFEPFFTTKEKGKGTGLGLPMCYGIVKQHGGDISIDTKIGAGTTFHIYLPRVNAVKSAKSNTVCNTSMPRGRETVLLVEDEDIVRGAASYILRSQGYTVIEASTGSDALKLAEEKNCPLFDLLFTDMVMPDMNGRELASRLQNLNRVHRILYTSGYIEPELLQTDKLGPNADFLQKPFTPVLLTEKVRKVLDRK